MNSLKGCQIIAYCIMYTYVYAEIADFNFSQAMELYHLACIFLLSTRCLECPFSIYVQLRICMNIHYIDEV